jgi:DNA polymerase/3'-5' exonuclease PolX
MKNRKNSDLIRNMKHPAPRRRYHLAGKVRKKSPTQNEIDTKIPLSPINAIRNQHAPRKQQTSQSLTPEKKTLSHTTRPPEIEVPEITAQNGKQTPGTL